MSIFHTRLTTKLTYTGIKLLLNSMNRDLSISHYMKKGIFYRANSYTVISLVNSSTVTTTKKTTSQNLQRLEKHIQLIYFHVTRNLANCVLNQLIFQFQIVCTLFGLEKKISVFSKWADSQLGFWTTLDLVQIWTNQSKWLIQ